jgi:hypothetical protein
MVKLVPVPTVPLVFDLGAQGVVLSFAQVLELVVPEDPVVYPCAVALALDIIMLVELDGPPTQPAVPVS